MSVGERLREFRESHGLSQKEFAEKIGAGFRTYQDYERDIRTPKMAHLQRLAELGCDLTWLITEIRAPAPERTADAPPQPQPTAPARVDRELWRQLRKLVRDVYAREGVKLPEAVLDDVMISKYNILARYGAAPDVLPTALGMIEAQLLEEMAQDHPDAATSKHRA